jgi:hypothetical protein
MFHLGIDTPESLEHPVHDFDTLLEAQEAVRSGIKYGYVWFEKERLLISTGPGSVFRILSHESLERERTRPLKGYLVVAQIRRAQLPPFVFESEDEALYAIDNARVEGDFVYCAEADHDYTHIHMGPGIVLIGMTAEDFIERQRRALEAHLQQRAAAAGEGTVGLNQPPRGKIILGSGN